MAAPVGYIGHGLVFTYPIRGMSFNVKAHQQIFNGDPASNEPDQPIYHVGPIEVEGDVAWPVVSGDPVNYAIIKRAITRISSGGIGTGKTLEPGDIECWFPPGRDNNPPAYTRIAKGCIINRLSYKGTAGERVEGSINVIGMKLNEEGADSAPVPFDMGRVLTWNDVRINASLSDTGKTAVFAGCVVKEFNYEITNNVTRANTYGWPESMLGTDYAATALILGRRQVSGSLTFLGSASTQETAKKNMVTETSKDELMISFGSVQAKFHRVMYELQQIDLTSGVIYGRTSFTAHGGGPGEPSIEFTMDTPSDPPAPGSQTPNEDQWNKDMKALGSDMANR